MQTHKIAHKAYLFDCNESIFIGFKQSSQRVNKSNGSVTADAVLNESMNERTLNNNNNAITIAINNR